jgi:hypothetical protein
MPNATVTVILPRAKAPGVVAVGPYTPGTEYAVSPDEAKRLVEAKGFEIVTAAAPAAITED